MTFSFESHEQMTHLLYFTVQNHHSLKYYVSLDDFSLPVWILSWSGLIPKWQLLNVKLVKPPLLTEHTLLQIRFD